MKTRRSVCARYKPYLLIGWTLLRVQSFVSVSLSFLGTGTLHVTRLVTFAGTDNEPRVASKLLAETRKRGEHLRCPPL